MLKKAQKRYGKMFEDHFNQIFGEGVEVICTWGFPVVGITLKTKEGEINTHWYFSINTISKDYDISTTSFIEKDEVNTSAISRLDSKTLNFIVDRTVELSESLFAEPVEEPVEEAVEELVEEVVEQAKA